MIRSIALIFVGFLINAFLIGGLEWAGYDTFFSVNSLLAGFAIGLLICAGITISYSIQEDIHNDE